MGEFLVKKFIKDYDNIQDMKVRGRYGVLSAVVGIICNVILFAGKFIIGALSNSISILSDGFNNLSDCASCVVTIIGYKMAAKPADKDHPFGHGRIEYLTSLVIAVVILLVGCELFRSSVTKIIHPEMIEFSYVALGVLIFSILVKIWMGVFNRSLGKRIQSGVLLATSKDSFNDVFATLAALAALLASRWTSAPVDGVMGVLVSLFILISGFGIVKETVNQLIGRPADEELVEQLQELVLQCPLALGMHDLIIHSYGPGNLIGSVHVEVDYKENIMLIHEKIDALEREIYEQLNILITIHMDPVETDNEQLNRYRQIIAELVKEIHHGFSIHDFRMVPGIEYTTLIFDLLIPYECEMSEDEIQKTINHKLEKREEKYYTVITFDKSFC